MAGNTTVSSRRLVFLPAILMCLLYYNDMFVVLLWGAVLTVFALGYHAIFTSFPEKEIRTPRRLTTPIEVTSSPIGSDWDKNSLLAKHPEISRQIEVITDLLIRDFIMSWFQNINEDAASAFPQTLRAVILQSVCKIQGIIVKMDEANLIILKLLPLFTKHFKAFCSSRDTVLSDLSFQKHDMSNIDLQIAVEFNKNYKIHKALSLRASCLKRDVERHVSGSMEALLPYIIDAKELSSSYVSILLREVLSACIVTPLIMKFSDADQWNSMLISISEKILEEQSQVYEIRRILSKEVEEQDTTIMSEGENNHNVDAKLDLNPTCSGKQFENYLRQISQLNSVPSLQAARYSLLTKLLQLREETHMSKDLLEYKKKLTLSLNLIQTRLKYIDSRNCETKVRKRHPFDMEFSNAEKTVDEFGALLDVIKLEDILEEQACLIHFEGYLKRSSNETGIFYLNYWKLVEKMKNPLEDATTEDLTVNYSNSEVSDLRHTAGTFFKGAQLEHMKSLDAGLVNNIILFITSSVSNEAHTYILARRSMLLLQNEAQKALEKNFFAEFKKSKFFLNMISDPEFAFTNVYSGLIALPKSGENKSSSKAHNHLNSVRIFTNPDIDDALDNILNGSKESRKRSLSQRQTRSVLFGDENSANVLFKDSIFAEDENNDPLDAISLNNSDDDFSDALSSTNRIDIDVYDNEFDNRKCAFANLKEDIAKLTISVDQTEKELELLNHLILKAELTNNQNQLRLLKKSQRALLRDLENKDLLKQQYMVQENANSLYKKTKICIQSYVVDSHLESNREVIYYLINIDHIYNGQITSWEIPRRFSEFYRLNVDLKKKYKHLVKHLQKKDIFPEKVKMALKYHVSKSLLYEERKSKLERYLRELLAIPEVCQDDMFRKFLTDPSPFIVSSNSADEQQQKNALDSSIPSLGSSADLSNKKNSSMDFQTRQIDAKYEDELSFYEDERNFYSNNENGFNPEDKSFVKAICDFFISIFSLNKTNSGWLRGRAIITVLQQLLGSAIEKYIKDSVKRLRSDSQICDILLSLKNMLWSPEGILERKDHSSVPPRTEGEMKRTQADSQMILQCLFTEVCGKVVGLRNAREAAINIHGMVQNPYLNASLLLEVLDLILNEILICENEKS